MDNHPNDAINNLINKFLTANFDTPSLRAGDWLMAIVSLAVGVWYSWDMWIVVGIVGLFLAWWRPMTRLQKFAGGVIRSAHGRRR
ncbi:hypothetical protein HFN89_02940 [Rhizobium laguerreae]|nr:hypothetical protein [Rhizobium laguerreae]